MRGGACGGRWGRGRGRFPPPAARAAPAPAWRGPPPPALLADSLLLPACHQPPPMFGPRGATLPPRYMRPPRALHPAHPAHSAHEPDGEFWCETCDRAFNNPGALEKHKAQHEKCNIDGCTFVAHPKVITRHIQMQHSSGLFSKISMLNDPEEIKKWKDERRKKYPTKMNIEKKHAEIEAKIDRGEKMGLKRGRFAENKGDQRSNFNGSKKRPVTSRRRPKLQKVQNACPISTPKHNLPAFAGISHLLMETEVEEIADIKETENFKIVDEIDDWNGIECKENGDSENSNAVCGALTELMGNYGSSDEDDSAVNTEIEVPKNVNEEVKIQHKIKSLVEPVNAISKKIDDFSAGLHKFVVNTESNNVVSDDSGPEEVKTIKIPGQTIIVEDSTPKLAPIKPKLRLPPKEMGRVMKRNYSYRKLPSTLLEKLLTKEIQHERNITLQCIRYIVKNNYFQR